MPDSQLVQGAGDGLERVTQTLLRISPDLDPVAVAEALWLAATAVPRNTTDVREGHGQQAVPTAADHEVPQRISVPLPHTAVSRTRRGEGPPAHAVGVPGVDRLPTRRLARALQPFKQTWRRGSTLQFDLDATIASYGRTGELLPVFTPAAERWFELALVLDRSASMTVWRDTTDQLTRILRNMGAFRTVTVWELHADLPDPVLQRKGSPASDTLPFTAIRSPRARRLTVVVSDCTSSAWRDRRLWEQLHRWARQGPAALINPLPPGIWRHIGVDLPAVRISAAAKPGAGRPLLRPAQLPLNEDEEWLAVPALSLSPRSLGQWARVLMRADSGGCDALLVAAHEDRHTETREAPPGAPTPEGFRYLASSAAMRLAALCSPFPAFTVDMIRFVAETLVPEATTADIAELVVSGPLAVHRSSDDKGVWLEYQSNIRSGFEAMLGARDAWRLHDAIVAQQNSREGLAGHAHALVGDRPGRPPAAGQGSPPVDAASYVLRVLERAQTVGQKVEVSRIARRAGAPEEPAELSVTGSPGGGGLRDLISRVRWVLFEFDGPICRLFAGHPAQSIGNDLVGWLERRGLRELLTEYEARYPDPHVVLRAAQKRLPPGTDILPELEERLTQIELRAANSAFPTAYADPLIRTWHAVGVRLAIATNVSPHAVARYLDARGLTAVFAPHIYGRSGDLQLLKPHPHSLHLALRAMGASPEHTLMIGDTPSDLAASQSAGIPFLGYGRNAAQTKMLRDAGAETVLNSLEPVLTVIRS
ncbi:HAD-IA family hydrolase [Streptomyces sp. NPDC002688]|uniref:HAD-IA family hydrolase n=1 Tax=Streptomyces sp. NPDC002688 TaxID=3154423 RepID=UPI00332890E8